MMKPIRTVLTAVLIGASAAATVIPASAQEIFRPRFYNQQHPNFQDNGARGAYSDGYRGRYYGNRNAYRNYGYRNYGYRDYRYGRYGYRDRDNVGAAIGAGAVGLAAGAILGGALSRSSNATVSSCAARFKSYDPQSGTYLGYDGRRHACP